MGITEHHIITQQRNMLLLAENGAAAVTIADFRILEASR